MAETNITKRWETGPQMEEMEFQTRNNMKTTTCPHCGGELNAGQILGQLARGTTRRLSSEHRAKLNESLAKARERLAQVRADLKKQSWIKVSP